MQNEHILTFEYVSYLEVVNEFLYFQFSLMHACHIFEAHTFTWLPIHDGELGHLQLILLGTVECGVSPQNKQHRCQFTKMCFIYKSAEAAISATHASKSKDIPENRHTDGSHAQSIDCTETRIEGEKRLFLTLNYDKPVVQILQFMTTLISCIRP